MYFVDIFLFASRYLYFVDGIRLIIFKLYLQACFVWIFVHYIDRIRKAIQKNESLRNGSFFL